MQHAPCQNPVPWLLHVHCSGPAVSSMFCWLQALACTASLLRSCAARPKLDTNAYLVCMSLSSSRLLSEALRQAASHLHQAAAAARHVMHALYYTSCYLHEQATAAQWRTLLARLVHHAAMCTCAHSTHVHTHMCTAGQAVMSAQVVGYLASWLAAWPAAHLPGLHSRAVMLSACLRPPCTACCMLFSRSICLCQ